MNLSLVRPAEKLALYLQEAGGQIKSQPLWGSAFIHLFIYFFYSESDLHRGCLSNVQPPGCNSFLRLSYWSPHHWRVKKKELPEYPGRQTQSKPPRVLIQMPSCRQGESSHSFTSRSHSVPKYPWGQIHRNLRKVWQSLIRRKPGQGRARQPHVGIC